MSKRKAKEKTIKGFSDKSLDDDDQEADDPDFVDSDTDPVWMPGAKVVVIFFLKFFYYYFWF